MPSGIDTRGMPHGIHTVDSDFSESRQLFKILDFLILLV